jgi:hypothetical protein
MKNWIVILLTGLTLLSCDPVKRHSRLVKKFPHVHQQDTVIIRDTVRIDIPEVSVDTVFHEKLLRDTVVIQKERLKVTMYTVHDSIYVDAKCDTITVEKIVERKVPIRYYEKTSFDWESILPILSFIIIIIILYQVIKKYVL